MLGLAHIMTYIIHWSDLITPLNPLAENKQQVFKNESCFINSLEVKLYEIKVHFSTPPHKPLNPVSPNLYMFARTVYDKDLICLLLLKMHAII